MVFNTGPHTVLPDNSILITANMQPETGFPSSHQLKSYIASKSRLKLAAHAVLSADAGFLFHLLPLLILHQDAAILLFLSIFDPICIPHVLLSFSFYTLSHGSTFLWHLLLLLHLINGLLSRTTWVSRHQKGEPFWILLSQ